MNVSFQLRVIWDAEEVDLEKGERLVPKFTVEISKMERVYFNGETNARAKVKISEWEESELMIDTHIGVIVHAEDDLTIEEIERAALKRASDFLVATAALSPSYLEKLLREQRIAGNSAKFQTSEEDS